MYFNQFNGINNKFGIRKICHILQSILPGRDSTFQYITHLHSLLCLQINNKGHQALIGPCSGLESTAQKDSRSAVYSRRKGSDHRELMALRNLIASVCSLHERRGLLRILGLFSGTKTSFLKSSRARADLAVARTEPRHVQQVQESDWGS